MHKQDASDASGAVSKNSRNTKQKNIIVNYLRNNNDIHLTAEQIIELLRANNTPVARATVYRHLSGLEEVGMIRKYIVTDGAPACYQYIDRGNFCHEHYHLRCIKCGQLVHFGNDEIRNAFDSLTNQQSFFIDLSKTVFYGYCKECYGTTNNK